MNKICDGCNDNCVTCDNECITCGNLSVDVSTELNYIEHYNINKVISRIDKLDNKLDCILELLQK